MGFLHRKNIKQKRGDNIYLFLLINVYEIFKMIKSKCRRRTINMVIM